MSTLVTRHHRHVGLSFYGKSRVLPHRLIYTPRIYKSDAWGGRGSGRHSSFRCKKIASNNLNAQNNNNVTESINSADELRGFTKGILSTTKDVFLHVVQNDAKETERLFEMMQPIINDLNKDNPDRTVILRYETESSAGKYAAIGASAGVLIGGGVALTLVAVGAITGPFFAVILGGVVIGALVGAAIGAITGLMNRKKVIVLTINSSGVVSKKTVDRRKLAVSQVQRG